MSYRVNVNLEQFSGGRRRVAERVRRIGGQSDSAMTEVSLAMAEEVKREIIGTLNEAGSGELWSRDNPYSGKWWSNFYSRQSGAAGEPPVSQSGGLAASVKVNPTSKGRANLDVGGSGSRPGLAALLEFGGWQTVFGNIAAAHPFVMPSLENVRGDLRQVAINTYKRIVGI